MGGSAQGLCSIDSIAFVRGCVETNEEGNKSCPEGLCLFVSRDEKVQIVRAIGCRKRFYFFTTVTAWYSDMLLT